MACTFNHCDPPHWRTKAREAPHPRLFAILNDLHSGFLRRIGGPGQRCGQRHLASWQEKRECDYLRCSYRRKKKKKRGKRKISIVGLMSMVAIAGRMKVVPGTIMMTKTVRTDA